MIDINKIDYRDECDTSYKEAIDKVKTLEDLKELLAFYRPIASDAYEIVEKFTAKDFKKFQADLKKERKGVFSNNEKLMVILMPATMFHVSIVANKFHAPWGCAFIRMKEFGAIAIENDVAIYRNPLPIEAKPLNPPEAGER